MAILLFLLSTSVMAAGGGFADLVYPAINFILLFGFLFFKLRKPIAAYFVKWSEQVEDVYERAQARSKEANHKLEMLKGKMNNFSNEKDKIVNEAKEQIQASIKKLEEETAVRAEKIKADAILKVQIEKKQAIEEINNNLVSEVIRLAKDEISSNPSSKQKVNEKMIGQIG